jgi:hypothetical protein
MPFRALVAGVLCAATSFFICSSVIAGKATPSMRRLGTSSAIDRALHDLDKYPKTLSAIRALDESIQKEGAARPAYCKAPVRNANDQVGSLIRYIHANHLRIDSDMFISCRLLNQRGVSPVPDQMLAQLSQLCAIFNLRMLSLTEIRRELVKRIAGTAIKTGALAPLSYKKDAKTLMFVEGYARTHPNVGIMHMRSDLYDDCSDLAEWYFHDGSMYGLSYTIAPELECLDNYVVLVEKSFANDIVCLFRQYELLDDERGFKVLRDTESAFFGPK